MKANKLMIGDWVEVISNDHLKYVQIAEIYQNSILTKESEFESEEVSIDNIKPIPLTPEILEKNGFTDWADHSRTTRSCSLLVDKTNIIVQKIDGNDYIFTQIHRAGADSCEFRMDLKYVHELQHALRLLKIEKEIEL